MVVTPFPDPSSALAFSNHVLFGDVPALILPLDRYDHRNCIPNHFYGASDEVLDDLPALTLVVEDPVGIESLVLGIHPRLSLHPFSHTCVSTLDVDVFLEACKDCSHSRHK